MSSLRETRPTLKWHKRLDLHEFTPEGFCRGESVLPTVLQGLQFTKGNDRMDIGDTDWGHHRVNLDATGFNGVELISLETPNGLVSLLHKHKIIQVTSAIFVQLIYSVLASPNEKSTALFKTPISPLFSIIDRESYTLKCLEVSQRDAEFLSCVPEKEYLIKIGNGMYLGLTYEGVVVGTLEMFRELLSDQIRQQFELVLSHQVIMMFPYDDFHKALHSSTQIAQLYEMRNKKSFQTVFVRDYFRNRIKHNYTKVPCASPKLVYPLTICVDSPQANVNKGCGSTTSTDSLGLKNNSPTTVLCNTSTDNTQYPHEKSSHFSIVYEDMVTL